MSAKQEDGAMLAFVLAVVLVPLTILVQGVTLSMLWGWFVTPALGLAEISIAQAAGLVLIADLFKFSFKKPEEDGRTLIERVCTMYAQLAFQYPIFLGLGLLVKSFL